MHRFPSQPENRRRALRCGGFTLLELVIVLMVIVVVMSLTWPRLMRFAGENRLREWSGEVRTDMSGARIKAIENGLVYQFRYEPGGRWYAVLPHDRPDSGNATADSTAGKSRYETANSAGPPAKLSQLPEGLRFRFKDGQPTEELGQEWIKLLETKESLGRVSWSLPIMFYLDGTADSATVYLEDEQDQKSQLLTLRGLTGSVSSGPIVKDVKR